MAYRLWRRNVAIKCAGDSVSSLVCLSDPAAVSIAYYKHAFLDYDQLIGDGFYHVRKKFSRLPSLPELEANPQLFHGQVAMLVDRSRDQPLLALEARISLSKCCWVNIR